MMDSLRKVWLTTRRLRLRQARLFAAAVLVAVCSGCDGGGVEQNPDGTFRGTGDITYKYETGEVLRVDSYVDGKLKRSKWFRPDGRPVFVTDWSKKVGFEYYLHPDGSLKTKYTMRDGVAHGAAWEYDESGKEVWKSIFVNGEEMGE